MRRSLFPPGSTFWLLSHELRLALRGIFARKGGAITLLVLAIGLVLFTVFGGVPVAVLLRRSPLRLEPTTVMTFDGALVVIFTLILSQTLSSATSAFYERGDLDLLLASPTPPRRVLTVRAVSVALTPYLWFAMFLTPLAGPLVIIGQAQWLAAYLVLACLALLAAAAGLGLAMALFGLIGARATRTVGQLAAAVIGALFFLMSQAKSLLPDNGRALFGGALAWAQSGLFDPGAPLAWPTRAVMGDPLALLVFTTLSLGVFLGVTAALGRRFAADASLAAGAGADRTRRSSAPVTAAGFRDGVFLAMMRKEIRLLVRDPTLLSQVLLRTLYILPMTFVLARNAGRSSQAAHGLMGSFTLAAGAGAVSFMAGQVAGSLAWIAISAEDAPELIACAPVLAAVVRRAKLTAVMIPVAALLAMPLGALLVFSPWIGVCALAGSAASALSSGLINLWFEKPAPRKAFRSRRGGSVLGASAELLIGLGWGTAAAMAAFASPWALIPTAVTLAALAALYGLSAPDRAY